MTDETARPKVVVQRTVVDKEQDGEVSVDPDSPLPGTIGTTTDAPEKKFSPEIEAAIEERVRARNVAFTEILLAQNKQNYEKVMEELRAKMTPPSEAEIQKMLDQEYLTFKVKLPWKDTEREFVLTEVPQSVEKKFYAVIKDKFVPLAQEIGAMKMNLLDGGDLSKKLLSMANTVEPLMDVMCECAMLSLNPQGKVDDLTSDWVREHLSSTRILSIVNAQAQCNRMRDFFSILSRGTKALT